MEVARECSFHYFSAMCSTAINLLSQSYPCPLHCRDRHIVLRFAGGNLLKDARQSSLSTVVSQTTSSFPSSLFVSVSGACIHTSGLRKEHDIHRMSSLFAFMFRLETILRALRLRCLLQNRALHSSTDRQIQHPAKSRASSQSPEMAASLLRRVLEIYGIRTQIFGHFDAFDVVSIVDVASIVDAARLRSSIRPIERAKFLHPMLTIFTDFEISDIHDRLRIEKDHKIVIWGDTHLILRGTSAASTRYRGNPITISIAEICTEPDVPKIPYKDAPVLQHHGIPWGVCFKMWRDPSEYLNAPGIWTHISDEIVSRNGSRDFRAIECGIAIQAPSI